MVRRADTAGADDARAAARAARPSVLDEDLSDVSLADMLAEIKRELALRERVYPGFVERGKLAPHQADRQMRRLRAALKALLIIEAAA